MLPIKTKPILSNASGGVCLGGRLPERDINFVNITYRGAYCVCVSFGYSAPYILGR